MNIIITRGTCLKIFAHTVAKVENIDVKKFEDAEFLKRKIAEYVPKEMYKKLTAEVFKTNSLGQLNHPQFFYDLICAIRFSAYFHISQKILKYFINYIDPLSTNSYTKAEFKPDIKTNDFVNTCWELFFAERQENEKYYSIRERGISKAIISFKAFDELEVSFLKKKGNVVERYIGRYEIFEKQNQYLKIILESNNSQEDSVKMMFYIGTDRKISFALGSIEDRRNRALTHSAIIEKIICKEDVPNPKFFFNHERRSTQIPRSFWYYLVDVANPDDIGSTSRDYFDFYLKSEIEKFDSRNEGRRTEVIGGKVGMSYEDIVRSEDILLVKSINTEEIADLLELSVYKKLFNDNNLLEPRTGNLLYRLVRKLNAIVSPS